MRTFTIEMLDKTIDIELDIQFEKRREIERIDAARTWDKRYAELRQQVRNSGERIANYHHMRDELIRETKEQTMDDAFNRAVKCVMK